MRKWLVVLCVSLFAMTVFSFGEPVKANSKFTDVGSSHRAQEEIYYLVNKGIASGISSSKFAPDRNVTRGEAAIVLGRAIGVDGTKRTTDFSDVKSGNTASGYIQALVNKGVISGYPDGTFKPDRTLTRGEMALLINRAFNWEAGSVSTASSNLMNLGIAQGVADGSFGAGNVIKRSDFAVFVTRSMEPSFRITESERFSTAMYVNVGSDTLNFRQGPSTSHSVISKLSHGTKVLRAHTQGSWSYIKVGNRTGYVSSSYLSATKPAAPTQPATPGQNGKKLSDLVVIIDPGHGGSDPGAGGNGLLEKTVVLNVGKKMAKYYDRTPIQTKLTRSGDTYPTLDQRAAYAQKVNGDIFVSIHTNAFNGSANGQETYYSKTAAVNPNANESRALAIYTQYRMQEAWNLSNRGVKEAPFLVLRKNTIPAVLAEIGFIDSAKDSKLMKSEAELEKMARGLFLATLDYYYYYEGRQDVLPLYNTVSAKPSGKRH